MARIKNDIQTLSGKIGAVVYVDSDAYGPHTRQAVKPGTRKNEPALKAQYSRTQWLNSIAGAINDVVRKYAPILKPAAFYHRVSSLLRKEPDNNRLLLLCRLRGMEINPDHPLHKLGTFTCNTAYNQTQLNIELDVTEHPLPGTCSADSWYFAVILIVWQNGMQVPYDHCQLSEWVSMKDEEPVFDFVFKRPVRGKQWLLCVQQVLGKHGERIENLKAEGMMIADAGSFDKKDLRLLQKRTENEKQLSNKARSKKAENTIVRVKRR